MLNHHLRRTSFSILLLLLLALLLAACVKEPAPVAETGTARIHDIQGCSHRSPYLGRQVEGITGIVTKKSSNGFYMQDDLPDEERCSSEAIFVFTQTYPDVRPGDKITVSGQVDEFLPGSIEDRNLTLTQLTDAEFQIISRGNKLPDAIKIGEDGYLVPDQHIDNDGMREFQPAEDGIDFFESLESMLVTVKPGRVVGPRNPFNEVVIIPDESVGSNLISTLGALIQQDVDPNPERIILNLNTENRNKVNLGSRLNKNVTGIIDYAYGNYKINVFGLAEFSEVYPVVEQINNDSNSLTLASYNVENLSVFDDSSKFRNAAAHIVKSMDNPDIVILHEVMDDSGTEDDGVVIAQATLARLVEQIELMSGVHYSFIDNPPINNQDGGINGGNIRTCMLFREDTGVRVADLPQNTILKENPTRIGPDEWPFSVTRKPLVVLFEYNGEQFLVTGVHFTSRGADSPLFGSIQPPEKPEEEKRNQQALYINRYLSEFHRRLPDIPIIVAGDLNDDPWSNTLSILSRDLLFNLNELIPENERYTYILDGNAIQLDYILISNDLDWKKTFQILHFNTSLDHTEQVSDHDAVISEIYFP